jgi:translocation and assembly module TamA
VLNRPRHIVAFAFAWFVLFGTASVRADVEVEVRGLPSDIRDNVLVFLSLERYKSADDLSAETIERLQNRIDREVRSALRPFGYYEPKVVSNVVRGPSQSERDWLVTVQVDPGKPIVVADVQTKVTGPGADDPVFAKLIDARDIRAGRRLSHAEYEQLKGGLQRAAATTGYLDARMVRSELLVDPPNYTARVTLELTTGPRYRFGATTIEQDAVDEALIRRYLRYRQDEPFNTNDLLRTQFALDDSQYFASVEVLPQDRDQEEHIVPIVIRGEKNRRNRYSYGVGYGTDTETRGTIAWDNRRVNTEGHRFRAEIKAAAESQTLNTRYLIPIGDPAVEKLSLELNAGREDLADISTTNYDFRPSITQLRGRWQREFFTLVTRTRTDFADSQTVDTLLIPGISFAAVPPDYLGEALLGRELFVELRGSHGALGSDSDFLQLRAQAERVFDIGRDWHVLLRGELGATAVAQFSQLPGSQRFFAGGDRSVRGFGFNELSPLEPVIDRTTGEQFCDPIPPEEQQPGGPVCTPRFEKRGGRHLFTGSIELVRDLPRNFAAAVFFDVGNAFEKFGDPLERSVGIGIRFRLPVVTVGIDIAQAISRPPGEDRPGPRLHLNFSPKL